MACQAYYRNRCLAQRIQFVKTYLFAKIWYVAQILPPNSTYIKQLEAIATWYIWHGAIFRVPLATLQRMKETGGWGMEMIGVKCKVLLYRRML
jgi:CHAT domain-containing protein